MFPTIFLFPAKGEYRKMKIHLIFRTNIYLVCLLVLACRKVSTASSDTTATQQDCLDVAIIGGGVGGTYAAYKLRNDGLRIGLFEYTDRIGGRIFTAKIPGVEGVTVEFGAMRFLPQEHTSLTALVNELGLTIVDFSQGGVSGSPNTTKYFLRGQHLMMDELFGPQTPYTLKPSERLNVNSLIWKLFTENTNMSRIRPPTVEETYTITTTDGYLLYKLSLDEFYSRYASREAYWYIRDVHGPPQNGYVSAHIMLDLLAFDTTVSEDFKTIYGGFDQLPKGLKTVFLAASEKHSVHLQQELVSIDGQLGNYSLRFVNSTPSKTDWISDTVVCAKKVVLALQRDCVNRLSFPPFQDPKFRELVNSVIDNPSNKIFLAYPTAWWKKRLPNIVEINSDLPSMWSLDWRKGTNGPVIYLASYNTIESNTVLWRRYQNRGSIINGSLPGEQRVTTEVLKLVQSYLSQLHGIPESEIPTAVGGGMQLWNHFPFRAAWTYYKPGYNREDTRDYLMKPFPNHDVFIVGNSWWPGLTGWVESTLRMVELWFDRYHA